MCTQEDWTGEFAKLALADGHAVLAVDLPGHGSSVGGGVQGSGGGANFSSAAPRPSGDGEDLRCGGGGGAEVGGAGDWSRFSNLPPRAAGGGIGRENRDGEVRDGGGAPSWGLGGVSLSAEAVCTVCDAVGVGPYVVVGYSMGGRVALAMAGRRPDLMEGGGGLVLVSSSPGLTR